MTAGPAPPGGACPSLWTPSIAEALSTDDATRKGSSYNAGAVVVFKGDTRAAWCPPSLHALADRGGGSHMKLWGQRFKLCRSWRLLATVS
jgi:hypothetical protein